MNAFSASQRIRQCRLASRTASVGNLKGPNHYGGVEQPNRSGPLVYQVSFAVPYTLSPRAKGVRNYDDRSVSTTECLRKIAVTSSEPSRVPTSIAIVNINGDVQISCAALCPEATKEANLGGVLDSNHERKRFQSSHDTRCDSTWPDKRVAADWHLRLGNKFTCPRYRLFVQMDRIPTLECGVPVLFLA